MAPPGRVPGPGRLGPPGTAPGTGLRSWLSPHVEDELVPDEGELVVDEVRHHGVVFVPRVLEALLAAGLAATDALPGVPHLVLAGSAALVARCVAKTLLDHMDRFVITNFRVFRVQGLLNRQTATMPLSRILDITVTTPLLGRVLGYGHVVFESAAQAQGLRDIRYIGDPHGRDLTMQRVIQRAGLRRNAAPGGQQAQDGGDSPQQVPPRPRGGAHPLAAGGRSGSSRRRRVGFGP